MRMADNNAQQTVVIKVGTSSICDETTQLPRLSILAALVETIVALRTSGHHVVLVTSGAIGVGMRTMRETTRPTSLARLQALAGVGQSQLMALYRTLFDPYGVTLAQVLLSRGDVGDAPRYRNASATLRELLDLGCLPVVNENDAVSVAEIKFGDNDTLSAVVARLSGASWLFLMTDVDALYDRNPRTDPTARPIRVVRDLQALRADVSQPGSAGGTGGMATKLVAAELAAASGCTTTILSSSDPAAIARAMQEDDDAVSVGTRFLAAPMPVPDKRWWLVHGMRSAGTVVVDHGANVALRHRASLFPAGVVAVSGTFSAAQAVDIVALADPTLRGAAARAAYARGEAATVPLGKGIATYSAAEVRLIAGKHSDDVVGILGYAESESVVERGSIVLVDERRSSVSSPSSPSAAPLS
ncbi:Aspartate/glutamate/uridylate kinase [Blastocladiella britannica]|nr:Aspartate/glutamate/uridylate kinase [Blastocladiella britannica]